MLLQDLARDTKVVEGELCETELLYLSKMNKYDWVLFCGVKESDKSLKLKYHNL